MRCNAFDTGLGQVTEASASTLSLSEELPPPDTLVGTVKFASGTPASVSITFAGSVLRFSLSVTGTKGSLEVSLSQLSLLDQPDRLHNGRFH